MVCDELALRLFLQPTRHYQSRILADNAAIAASLAQSVGKKATNFAQMDYKKCHLLAHRPL